MRFAQAQHVIELKIRKHLMYGPLCSQSPIKWGIPRWQRGLYRSPCDRPAIAVQCFTNMIDSRCFVNFCGGNRCQNMKSTLSRLQD